MTTGSDVFFPLAGVETTMGCIRCIRSPTAPHPELIIDAINKPLERQRAIATLMSTRSGLPGLRYDATIVQFRPALEDFQGQSYQLALAIADQLQHRSLAPHIGRVFATGAILPDEDGAIGAVDAASLAAKIKAISLHFDAAEEIGTTRHDVFLLPRANYPDLTTDDEAALEALRARGAIVHLAAHVSELKFLWRQ